MKARAKMPNAPATGKKSPARRLAVVIKTANDDFMVAPVTKHLG